MRYLNLNRAIARLILLQRIELASPTLKKIRKIFDTIRPDYFKTIFDNVKVLVSEDKKIHGSKRIVCSKFLN